MYGEKLNPVCGTEKQSQVEQQFGRLENSLTDLHSLLESLADRLRPVINQSAEKSAGVPCPAEPILVPHAERLRSADKGVRDANSKIDLLLKIIEL